MNKEQRSYCENDQKSTPQFPNSIVLHLLFLDHQSVILFQKCTKWTQKYLDYFWSSRVLVVSWWVFIPTRRSPTFYLALPLWNSKTNFMPSNTLLPALPAVSCTFMMKYQVGDPSSLSRHNFLNVHTCISLTLELRWGMQHFWVK